MDHTDGECASARQNFRGARARAEEFGKLGLGVPEFLDGIVEHINRIKAFVDVDRPPPRFIYFDECKKHVELVTFLRAFRRPPAALDLSERCAVLFVGTNRSESI